MKEEKQRLRSVIRAMITQLSPRYKEQASQVITTHLLAMPEYQAADTIFCFVGTASEIDTQRILEDALHSGKQVCVPLCTAPGIMELRQITSLDQLVPGCFGILEPPADAPVMSIDAVDLALIPCLTCNHLGHRLGKGGGYYDRFLSRYRGGAIMLCWERLIRQEIPLEPHDYPIPWVLTEYGLFEDGTPARLG